MERNRNEMDAGADPPPLQPANELAAIDGEPVQMETEDVEVPRMTALLTIGRNLGEVLHAVERPVIHRRIFRSALHKVIEFSELMDSDRRLNIAEVVLEAVGDHIVVPVAVF